MTTVTPLPVPVPTSADPDNFDARADAFLDALPLFATELNSVASEVNADAVSAAASAASALDSKNTVLATASNSVNFKGAWSGLTGAAVIPMTVYHNSEFWILITAAADITTIVPGVAANWVSISGSTVVETYPYENRNDVRTATAITGAHCVISGLGFFVFYVGATDIDDDESCFATASGRWIMEASGPEYMDTYYD